MTSETKFRASFVVTLLTLITTQFFFFENKRKFEEYQVSSKKIIDSVTNERDSLLDENFELNHWNGIEELIIDDLKDKYPKYKNINEDIEKERNSNKYE